MIRASDTCWWATTVSRRSGASVAEANESGRQGPGEGQREVEAVGRFTVLREVDHEVLEGQQHPGVDLQGQVQIQRPAAALLGVEVDLPGLAQRVGLDEVALVVHVEAVVDGVILDLGHVSGHVDDGHVEKATGGM
jgi:hypothetical protein